MTSYLNFSAYLPRVFCTGAIKQRVAKIGANKHSALIIYFPILWLFSSCSRRYDDIYTAVKGLLVLVRYKTLQKYKRLVALYSRHRLKA